MWAERAISEIEYVNVQQMIANRKQNLVISADKAKVYWRMVLACKRLGLEREMLAPLMKASSYAPDGKLIQKKLEAVEKQLENDGIDIDVPALENFSF